ncbi:MAG: hypothetical protein ACD_21C00126G0002 [uncultured bacterium]|nr:MAG: hypothetical protein ACD_21C00126G0002 [uncultured bacterium]
MQIIRDGVCDTKESVAKIEKRVQKKWEKTKAEEEAEAAGINMAEKPENTVCRENLKRFRAMRDQLGKAPTVEEYDAVNEAMGEASGKELSDLQLKELSDLQLKLIEIKAVSQAHQVIGEILSEITESADGHPDIQKVLRAELLLREVRTIREILPKAIKHSASKKGTDTARKNRNEKYTADQECWRNAAISILAGRTRKPGQRELARLVTKQFNPQMAEEEINKLADSRRRWIADLL